MKPEKSGPRTQDSGARTQEPGIGNQGARPLAPDPCPLTPEVTRAVEEYLAALEAGKNPSRQEFLARYPAIAEPLAECLDGLEFIQTAAPRLQESAAEHAAGPQPLGADFHPEGPLGDYRILREIGRGGMGV